MQDVIAVFPVAIFLDVELDFGQGEFFVAEDGEEFFAGKDVKLAFHAFRIGIKGASVTGMGLVVPLAPLEATLQPKFLLGKMNTLLNNLFVQRCIAPCKCPSIQRNQLRIVVQHLLKMRRKPLGVCAISTKTATNRIVNAAIAHFY